MTSSSAAHQTASERVAQRLKRAILDGKHAPGSRLPSERDLALELDVNRNAVREALRMLAQLGLVEVRHGAATRVRDFSREGGLELLAESAVKPGAALQGAVGDVMDFRLAYGTGMVELAAQHVDAQGLLELQAALAVMRAATQVEAWATQERLFMERLVEATHNVIYRLLQNTLARSFKSQDSFVAALFSHRRDVEEAYTTILQAMEHKKVDQAARTMRALMEQQRGWVMRGSPQANARRHRG